MKADVARDGGERRAHSEGARCPQTVLKAPHPPQSPGEETGHGHGEDGNGGVLPPHERSCPFLDGVGNLAHPFVASGLAQDVPREVDGKR